MSMNQTSTFEVLRKLVDSVGKVVAYKDLLGVIKASYRDASVRITEAPPELKPIMSRIRATLRTVGCDWTIRSVPRMGYQLLSPRNEK